MQTQQPVEAKVGTCLCSMFYTSDVEVLKNYKHLTVVCNWFSNPSTLPSWTQDVIKVIIFFKKIASWAVK